MLKIWPFKQHAKVTIMYCHKLEQSAMIMGATVKRKKKHYGHIMCIIVAPLLTYSDSFISMDVTVFPQYY